MYLDILQVWQGNSTVYINCQHYNSTKPGDWKHSRLRSHFPSMLWAGLLCCCCCCCREHAPHAVAFFLSNYPHSDVNLCHVQKGWWVSWKGQSRMQLQNIKLMRFPFLPANSWDHMKAAYSKWIKYSDTEQKMKMKQLCERYLQRLS